MDNVFRSARLTLDRAQHHISDFKAIVSDFHNSKPWSYIIDKESQPGKHIHKIQFTAEPPETLRCVLFDAANNLRAVLDQTSYAAAIASGKISPKKTKFPFGDDLASLNNDIEGRKVAKDVPAEIVAVFRRLEPYKGRNDSLWALNKLCNTKKHCSLVPINVADAKAIFSARLPSDFVVWTWTEQRLSWDSGKKELIIAIVATDPHPYISGHFTFDVAIEGIETQAGKPAARVLNAMASEVQRVLMATEAECRRLKFIA